MSLILGIGSEKSSNTRHKPVAMKPMNKHVKTSRKYGKKNLRSVSALSFSSHVVFFVQLMWSTQLSYYLSPNDNLQIVVANKLLC